MIAIELDLNYLAKYLNIDASRLRAYGNKSVEEIIELEAANGNTQAENYLLEVLKDPDAIIRLFKIGNAQNRWRIMREMNEDDLQYFLQFLEQKDLLNGLQFFTQDALINFTKELPKKEITKVLFECYSKDEFLKLVPEKELNKWFESDKVDPKKVLEELKGMNKEVLAQMVETVTGQPQDDADHKSLMQTIEGMNPKQFLDGVQSLKPQYKCKIILSMTQEDEKLWQEFSVDALTKPLEKLDKEEVIKGMGKLENDDLIKMLSNLPQDLMSVVTSQIDPEIFGTELCSQFQDLLKKVVSI